MQSSGHSRNVIDVRKPESQCHVGAIQTDLITQHITPASFIQHGFLFLGGKGNHRHVHSISTQTMAATPSHAVALLE